MCGIAGEFAYGTGEPVRRLDIERMTAAVSHRGPDDAGVHLDGPLGLGFRRLSIIDLAGGHQPMSDAAETVWVVFNGEIYNFRALRAELTARGHQFRTRCDTEVIVHGYREWGPEVLHRLNGMFGLAIWDATARRLVLARDRLGIKPLYYRIENGRLAFGSEIRAVVANDPSGPRIDPVALNLFLRYRYTPAPLTVYAGVRKLPAGNCLVVDQSGVREKTWWRFRPETTDPPSVDEAADRLLEHYRVAVSRQLESDVPLGLLLSGGLDSALLLGLMAEKGGAWPTYSVGYGTTYPDDELALAAHTAAAFGARHTGVKLDRSVFEDSVLPVVAALEEPVASASIIPMYHLCARAREDVKVALVGQGPDELFGGYTRHLGVRYGHLWRALPSGLRSLADATLPRLPRAASLTRGAHSLGEPDRLRRYQQVLSLMPPGPIDQLFRPGSLPSHAGDAILDCWGDVTGMLDGADELGGFNYLELRSTLPDELLMYSDKLSMAHGLELRLPYLDHELVEYAAGLPASLKIRGRDRKRVHRAAAARIVPREVLARPKRAFAVDVVDGWFRGRLSGRLSDLLTDSSSRMYDLLEPSAVQRLLTEHQRGRRDHHKILFSLVVFEEWMRSAGPVEESAVA